MTDLRWQTIRAYGGRFATIEIFHRDSGTWICIDLDACTRRRCWLSSATDPDGTSYLRHGDNPEALRIYQPQLLGTTLQVRAEDVQAWTESCHAYDDRIEGIA